MIPVVHVAVTLEQLWERVPGGTAVYALEVVKRLAQCQVRVSGVAALHRHPPQPAWRAAVPLRHLPLPRLALYESWQRLRRPPVQLATGPVDVVHATSFAIPPRSAPLVVTIHDLAFLHEPDHFTRRGVVFFQRGLRLAQREADAVIVPSISTQRDCMAAGLNESRMRVVPHGVDTTNPSAEDVRTFRAAHGLDRPYVLWCGTAEPRKNVDALVAAFAAVAEQLTDVDLVLAGPAGWGGAADIPAQIAGRVHRLGFLPREELHRAYAGAAAFCYPSLREGFGLPVLEAMTHAIPVVTSQDSAMAEVVGDSGVLVDPRDTGSIAAGLIEALNRATELGARAADRARAYTWERTAELTADVYREVVR